MTPYLSLQNYQHNHKYIFSVNTFFKVFNNVIVWFVLCILAIYTKSFLSPQLTDDRGIINLAMQMFTRKYLILILGVFLITEKRKNYQFIWWWFSC